MNLAIGRALVLPQPTKVHEDIIAIRGAKRREAQGFSRAQTQARTRTRGLRAVAGSRGHGEAASARRQASPSHCSRRAHCCSACSRPAQRSRNLIHPDR